MKHNKRRFTVANNGKLYILEPESPINLKDIVVDQITLWQTFKDPENGEPSEATHYYNSDLFSAEVVNEDENVKDIELRFNFGYMWSQLHRFKAKISVRRRSISMTTRPDDVLEVGDSKFVLSTVSLQEYSETDE